MARRLVLVSLVAFAGCRPSAPIVADDAGSLSVVTAAASSSAGACNGAGDCASGVSCVFEDPGCAVAGHCRAGGAPGRNCYVAIAMCACRDHHTFYGPGGCAGPTNERWELYACPCAGDADCGGGQRCVPTGARPHKPGATLECRAANDLR